MLLTSSAYSVLMNWDRVTSLNVLNSSVLKYVYNNSSDTAWLIFTKLYRGDPWQVLLCISSECSAALNFERIRVLSVLNFSNIIVSKLV